MVLRLNAMRLATVAALSPHLDRSLAVVVELSHRAHIAIVIVRRLGSGALQLGGEILLLIRRLHLC